MSGNQTLEAFVNTIRNLYQQTEPNYTDIYNTINSHLELFKDNGSNLLDNVLPVFTLPEYTLPNMAVLYAIVSQLKNSVNNSGATATAPDVSTVNTSAIINQETLLNNVENCINSADSKQVEIASDIYSDLCHFYTQRLIQLNKPKKGLLVLRNAIKNIQKDNELNTLKEGKLTTVHSDILQLSLASKNFTVALELMSHDILDIHKPSNFKFDSKYLLSYFYYAGCIYGAIKEFDSALFYLEQALTMPSMVVSQIMIESYKKFILISLISNGKISTLPKYTNWIIINQIKPMCFIYHELAMAFTSFDLEKLNQLYHKHERALETDKNVGLVKQLQNSFYKKNIQKLTKTFITLSLSDMAAKVHLPSAAEAESYMLNMIRDREIYATINQKDGMVSFHDNPEKYNNPAIMEDLTKEMFACIRMDANIKSMDKEITTHPHYIQKCQNTSSSLIDDNLQSANISSIRLQQSNTNLAM